MNQQQKDDTSCQGGGAINEKQRTQMTISTSQFDPRNVRAHLFHALEGMHRYPHYLSRWNERDMDELEMALQEQIHKIRQQRQQIRDRRNEIDLIVQQLWHQDERWKRFVTAPTTWDQVERYILHPAASKAIFHSRSWKKNIAADVSLSDALSGLCDIELDALTELMDEEQPEIFSMPLLAPEFCQTLCDYIQALSRLGNNLQLGQRAVNLDTIGLSWLNDLIFHVILRPISRRLFGFMGELDWRNGYVTGYAAQPSTATPRERLVTHTDDSEVTLNVCLGETFDGGLLEFRGLRGSKQQGQVEGTYQPESGKAILHSGRHFHDVTNVTKGQRFAWIMWGRSWQGARSKSCPCCWLNNRPEQQSRGGPCVCGKMWN
jgi:hypothetical protein